jgi:hypothetical protein
VFSPLNDLPNQVGIYVFVTTIFGGHSVFSPFWAIVFLNISFCHFPSNFIIHLLAINHPNKKPWCGMWNPSCPKLINECQVNELSQTLLIMYYLFVSNHLSWFYMYKNFNLLGIENFQMWWFSINWNFEYQWIFKLGGNLSPNFQVFVFVIT